MLAREYRLRKSSSFKYVFDNGRKYKGKYGAFFVISCVEASSTWRFGVVVSKKVGNAVIRNLLKRRLKQLAWMNLKDVKSNFCIVYVAYTFCEDYEKLRLDFEKTVAKILKEAQ